jgi:sterol desaturase/sphingolipid hydroxylase (fatty acid hydroxylase superfamily)
MSDASIRLAVFVGVLAAMALLQALFPRRRLAMGYHRWPANLGLVALNTLLLRLLLPAGAVGVALWANRAGFGLLHWLGIEGWLAIPIAMLLLDLLIYAQHVVFHAVPLLWRLHRVHHADQEIDVSTGLRFHPLEILLSMLIKMAAVALLGAPALAVLLFEVVLNGMAMFNHSNVRLPLALDAILRLLLVTPDMHRVHHSVLKRETNSNYGFNLSLWDRLFGSYVAQPECGHDAMRIGLDAFQSGHADGLKDLLLLPFSRR